MVVLLWPLIFLRRFMGWFKFIWWHQNQVRKLNYHHNQQHESQVGRFKGHLEWLNRHLNRLRELSLDRHIWLLLLPASAKRGIPSCSEIRDVDINFHWNGLILPLKGLTNLSTPLYDFTQCLDVLWHSPCLVTGEISEMVPSDITMLASVTSPQLKQLSLDTKKPEDNLLRPTSDMHWHFHLFVSWKLLATNASLGTPALSHSLTGHCAH
jgi:hypothetical protein